MFDIGSEFAIFIWCFWRDFCVVLDDRQTGMDYKKMRLQSRPWAGRVFSPDKHVFNILLVLNVTFTCFLLIGCSIPAWNVVDEYVPHFRNCSSADKYVGENVRRMWALEPTKVTLTSSLWYVNIRVTSKTIQYETFFKPLVFLNQEKLPDKIGECK